MVTAFAILGMFIIFVTLYFSPLWNPKPLTENLKNQTALQNNSWNLVNRRKWADEESEARRKIQDRWAQSSSNEWPIQRQHVRPFGRTFKKTLKSGLGRDGVGAPEWKTFEVKNPEDLFSTSVERSRCPVWRWAQLWYIWSAFRLLVWETSLLSFDCWD